jgi:hypothetical protein
MAFPIIDGHVDRSCRLTPPSPLSCWAWNCIWVTITHYEEVGVSADVPASAPPSGAAGGRRHPEVVLFGTSFEPIMLLLF